MTPAQHADVLARIRAAIARRERRRRLLARVERAVIWGVLWLGTAYLAAHVLVLAGVGSR